MAIYVITDGTAYKIGYTANNDVKDRLSSLQTGNPRKLDVVLVLPDATQDDEIRIHIQYSHKRCKGGQEWFALDQDDIKSIQERYDNGKEHECAARFGYAPRDLGWSGGYYVRPIRGR